ncbi:24996_t:CDS:1, partial [Racocetra persica]
MEGPSEEPMKKKQKYSKKKKTNTKKSLTGIQKAEICHLKQKGVSQIRLAEQFGVAEATISGIVYKKEKWLTLDLNSNNAYSKQQRTGKYPLVEEALALWISRANTALQTITGAIVKRKATQLTKGLEVTSFNTSDGWLSNFKKRYHIKKYKCLGEAASAPLENFSRFRSELQELIKKYKPEDVYNADETALYWCMEPDKTLADGPVAGKKKPKTV